LRELPTDDFDDLEDVAAERLLDDRPTGSSARAARLASATSFWILYER
jgi:hypothetical protein